LKRVVVVPPLFASSTLEPSCTARRPAARERAAIVDRRDPRLQAVAEVGRRVGIEVGVELGRSRTGLEPAFEQADADAVARRRRVAEAQAPDLREKPSSSGLKVPNTSPGRTAETPSLVLRGEETA
jgi:hypothetical protein